ncbi:MAG: hypothetical protein MJK10_22495, partial [Pseudomonadales bacterium]|nr:hypothetical protein [Pseudomonadales bacterium]
QSFEAVDIDSASSVTTEITDEQDPGPEDTVYAKISVDTNNAEEGDTIGYTVTLVDKDGNEVTVPAGKSVTVDLVWSGDAANASDAAPLPPSVTITGGNSQATFDVVAVDDYDKEAAEDLTATITGLTDNDQSFEAVAIDSESTVTTEITDEQNPGPEDTVYAKISVDTNNAEEGDTIGYTVTLVDKDGNEVTVPAGKSITVDLVWSGDAANASDAAPLPPSVTITGGNSQATFDVVAVDDYDKEEAEDLTATITGLTDNDQSFEAVDIDSDSSVTTEITDEQIPGPEDTVFVQISVDKAQVEEGGDLTYTVTLVDKDGNEVSVPAGKSITVDLDWSGMAANPLDVSLLPPTVTITDGSKATFVINTFDDFDPEGSEDLNAKITSVTDVDGLFENIEVGTPKIANSEITDGDSVVYAKISVDTNHAEEGDTIGYTVTLVDKDGNEVTVPAGKSITVDLVWSGDAANASDATPLPPSVTITGGNSQATFDVVAVDDYYKEEAEDLTATITSLTDNDQSFEGVAIGSDSTVTTEITDEQNPGPEDTVYAKISVDTNNAEEGDTIGYTVTLVDKDGNEVTVPAGKSITVDLVWSGDAANASDAAPLPPSVTITGGNSQATFDVVAVDDYDKEEAEDLTATITGLTDNDQSFEAVDIDSASSVTTEITDEQDPGPEDTVYAKISVDTNNAEEGDTIGYTVTLVDKDGNEVTVPAGKSVTVDLVWSGDAANASDAAPLPPSVTITGGNSQATFDVVAVDDYDKEAAEDLTATITGLTDNDQSFEAVAIDSESTVTTEITDEQIPGPEDTVYAKISVDTNNAEEGDTIGYTVTLVDKDGNEVTVPAGNSITVDLVWSGDAANASDAAPLPPSVTIT